jgi:L-aspartate oxidase
VARAIAQKHLEGEAVMLDARHIASFHEKFPTISQICRQAGLDPSGNLLPVCPVAHYHMGGVATDLSGRTTVSGLWACGEVACTGLHGANRLASNSLLEAVVMGQRVAADMQKVYGGEEDISLYSTETALPDEEVPDSLRQLMGDAVGLLRHRSKLERAVTFFEEKAGEDDRFLVAMIIACAALERCESRGGHVRMDYPETRPELARSNYMIWDKDKLEIYDESDRAA